MIKNFNSAIVLTANNPDAILTFTYEPGDSSGSFTPFISNSDYSKILINGMDYTKTPTNVIKMIKFNIILTVSFILNSGIRIIEKSTETQCLKGKFTYKQVIKYESKTIKDSIGNDEIIYIPIDTIYIKK
jgi:hypothetical protein